MEGIFTTLIPMAAVLVAFYFLLIRPESKRKKKVDAMRAGLKVGDEVTTIAGIIGTVCAVKDNTIVIETGADRVRIETTKWAVSSRGVESVEKANT